ncbi:TatD family hydrolase [Kangiella sp. TOML190]|uniref:TatD family hydrolase n=1 Tax=Kangiella sp. TOML190 TaxID=2931351 RepID=UPI00204017B7|nr:TatD family hydrolase [Kangiella sp. TOML190]
MFFKKKKQTQKIERKLFDSICHLDFPIFDKERDSIFERMPKLGIDGILIAGVTQDKWRFIRQLAALKKNVYSAIGLHPEFLQQHSKKNIRDLELAVSVKPLWAIGEIGLDYYEKNIDRKAQVDLFSAQLNIAKAAELPVILHVRKAHEDTLAYIKAQNFQQGGIVHAFNGSIQQAERYIDLGFKLSFGGAITYPNAVKLKKLVTELPLESMVLETNSPDMKPANSRKAYNTPFQIFDVFNEVCKLRQESADDIARITCQNSKQILRIQ